MSKECDCGDEAKIVHVFGNTDLICGRCGRIPAAGQRRKKLEEDGTQVDVFSSTTLDISPSIADYQELTTFVIYSEEEVRSRTRKL